MGVPGSLGPFGSSLPGGPAGENSRHGVFLQSIRREPEEPGGLSRVRPISNPGESRMTIQRTNWAGNVTFAAARFSEPSSVGELQRLVAAGRNIRHLQAAGFALHNTGSLPHIGIAGGCATGTHGSGNGNGNLSTAVSAIQLVTADGDLVAFGREADGDEFNGMVLALGSLGVITGLTLDIVPTFDVRQDVYDDLSRAQFDTHFDDIFAGGCSVSAFSDFGADGFTQVWRKRRVEPGDAPAAEDSWLESALAGTPRHPIRGMPATHTTAQLGQAGPWNQRLHFRLDFTRAGVRRFNPNTCSPAGLRLRRGGHWMTSPTASRRCCRLRSGRWRPTTCG